MCATSGHVRDYITVIQKKLNSLQKQLVALVARRKQQIIFWLDLARVFDNGFWNGDPKFTFMSIDTFRLSSTA